MAPKNLVLNSCFDLPTASQDFLGARNGAPLNWVRDVAGATGLYPWQDGRPLAATLDTELALMLNDAVTLAQGQSVSISQDNIPLPAAVGQAGVLSLFSNFQFGQLDFFMKVEYHDAAHTVLGTDSLTVTPANYASFNWPGTDTSRPLCTGLVRGGSHHACVRLGLIKNTAGTTPSAPQTNAYLTGVQFEAGSVPTAFVRNIADSFTGHSAATAPYYAEAQITRPYQYFFNGLLFGSGTSYLVEKVDGLLGGAPVRDQDQDLANDHGANPGVLLLGKRTLQFDMHVLGSAGADTNQKLLAASRAFQPPRARAGITTLPFCFWRAGDVRKYINVRCTRRDFSSDYSAALGHATGSVELQAVDPVIYSVFGKQATLTILSNFGSNALDIYATAYGYSPVRGDFNDGVSPVVEIFGPALNPTIGMYDPENRYIRLNVNLAAGDSVRINLKTKKVEKKVGAGAYIEDYSIVRSDSQWFRMYPWALNRMQFTRANTPSLNCYATISWNDAWN